MRCVTQSKLYAGPEDRGNCVQACVASIFELSEARAPAQGYVAEWTALNYPGLQYVALSVDPTSVEPTPLGHFGYWIATVHTQTEGFTDLCGRCWEYEGNEHGPPIAGPPRPCPLCGESYGLEKGTRPGYHAVVMKGMQVEHDPSPNVDWDRERVYVGAAWWTVADPSRVEPRRLPG